MNTIYIVIISIITIVLVLLFLFLWLCCKKAKNEAILPIWKRDQERFIENAPRPNNRVITIEIKDDDRVVPIPSKIPSSFAQNSLNACKDVDNVSDQDYLLFTENKSKISKTKAIEKMIFEKSFEIIDRRSKRKYPDINLKKSFLKEFQSLENGLIDWHNIYPDLRSGGTGYIESILKTGELLKPEKSNRYSKNRQEIYSLVNELIELRISENKKFKDSPNIEKYEQHLYVIKTWKKFKH